MPKVTWGQFLWNHMLSNTVCDGLILMIYRTLKSIISMGVSCNSQHCRRLYYPMLSTSASVQERSMMTGVKYKVLTFSSPSFYYFSERIFPVSEMWRGWWSSWMCTSVISNSQVQRVCKSEQKIFNICKGISNRMPGQHDQTFKFQGITRVEISEYCGENSPPYIYQLLSTFSSNYSSKYK